MDTNACPFFINLKDRLKLNFKRSFKIFTPPPTLEPLGPSLYISGSVCSRQKDATFPTLRPNNAITMEEEKQEADNALSAFSTSLDDLQKVVQPLLSLLDTLRTSGGEQDLDALSKARLHIALCYTVNTLFSMYLRTQGVDPMSHPVVDDITRVQDAFLRLRKVEAGVSTKPKPKPKRDTKVHIAKTKLAVEKLSAVVFPEEVDLLNAIKNSTKSKRFQSADEQSAGTEGKEEGSGGELALKAVDGQNSNEINHEAIQKDPSNANLECMDGDHYDSCEKISPVSNEQNGHIAETGDDAVGETPEKADKDDASARKARKKHKKKHRNKKKHAVEEGSKADDNEPIERKSKHSAEKKRRSKVPEDVPDDSLEKNKKRSASEDRPEAASEKKKKKRKKHKGRK